MLPDFTFKGLVSLAFKMILIAAVLEIVGLSTLTAVPIGTIRTKFNI